MTTMGNSVLNLDHGCRHLPKVLFLVSAVFGAGMVQAEQSIELMTVEYDLRHWLSLYQPSESLKVKNEITCLAQNIYFEARSEPEQGQLAVGYVVMNRVDHRHFPDSICGVVRQGGEKRRYRCQFTWWCDGRSDLPMNKRAWRQSLDLAWVIYRGEAKDPTDGALWYHADYVNPAWSSSLVLGKKIGQHLFYLSRKRPVYALNATPRLQPDNGPIENSEESITFPHFKVSPSYFGRGGSIGFPVLHL